MITQPDYMEGVKWGSIEHFLLLMDDLIYDSTDITIKEGNKTLASGHWMYDCILQYLAREVKEFHWGNNGNAVTFNVYAKGEERK